MTTEGEYKAVLIEQQIAAKDAEIERLKGQNDLLQMKVGCLESIRLKDRALVTELADALDVYIYWKPLPRAVYAVQKAREVAT